jgi:hypothetical protein
MPRTTPTFDVRTWQATLDANRDLCRDLRRIVGGDVYFNTPVEVVAGDAPPHAEGKPGYYTSAGGRSLIFDPIAYAKSRSQFGRLRLRHHAPTLRIVVGAGWCDQQRKFRNRAAKVVTQRVAQLLTEGMHDWTELFV